LPDNGLTAAQITELDGAISPCLATQRAHVGSQTRPARRDGPCRRQPPLAVAGFPVTVLNTVGAGDAFAGGLLYGRCQGWDWRASVRLANACGAIVVTRHGCAAAMPRLSRGEAFMSSGLNSFISNPQSLQVARRR
jgi:hypothetical protein